MNTMIKILLTILLVSSSFFAHSKLVITDSWARQSIPGAENGAAYAKLENTSTEEITIVAVSTDAARAAEIHEHIHQNGQMQMRRLHELVIPAGETHTLQPGGLHFMLFGLEQPLVPDATITLQLQQSNGETLTTEAVIKKL